MKRKTNVPIAGDSPGGSARRHVLRALAFLLVLLFASPQAKAYFFFNEENQKYFTYDISQLESKGYIDITFPIDKKPRNQEELWEYLWNVKLFVNGNMFLNGNSMGQDESCSIIKLQYTEGVVAEVQCASPKYDGTSYLGTCCPTDLTLFELEWQRWQDSNYDLGWITLRVWPKLSDLMEGSITISAYILTWSEDFQGSTWEPSFTATFSCSRQFKSAPALDWAPSSESGKFDFTFTPFYAGDFYYFDNDSRKTLSSTDRVTEKIGVSNTAAKTVTFTYGYSHSEYQEISYSNSATIPAYLLPEAGDFTATQSSPTTIDLKWKVPDYTGEDQYKDDEWVVQRADNADFTNAIEVCRKQFNVGQTEYEYTEQIADLNLNGTYYYRIRRTAVDKWGWASAVTRTAQVDISQEHQYVSTPTARMDESATYAVITWNWVGNIWTNNSTVTLIRTNATTGNVVTINLPQDSIKAQRYSDLLPTTCDVYTYRINVTPGSSNYSAQAAVDVESEGKLFSAMMGDFESIEASKGYYGDCIMLDWTTDEKPIETFSITARVHGSDTPYKQIGQLTASTGLTNYTYTYDKCVAGVLYDFQVLAISHCGNDAVTMKSDEIIGFSRPTGTVNGRITYGSGQNVKDVTVKAVPEENSFTKNKAYSFSVTNGTNYLEIEDDALSKIAMETATFQAWVKPKTTGGYIMQTNFCCLAMTNGYANFVLGLQNILSPKAVVNKGFVHLTAVAAPDSLLLYVNGEKVAGEKRDNFPLAITTNKVKIGHYFKGEIDEVRLWNRALTAQEIADNYGKCLVGDEDGLEAYYTFDPCVEYEFWDRSYNGIDYNKRDGVVVGEGITITEDVPTIDQLCYKGSTDVEGSYTVRGVPYYSNGTSYTLTPSLGMHKFDPSKELRFLSKNTENFTVNFTDVSSFPVSGAVYYENTNYPVEGCSFYIDGTICSKDGEMITTGADGKFEITVPIGDHFIEVRKPEQGHTFVNEGRYPADPDKVGYKQTFDSEKTGLTFYESTLVNFSGRVTGGSIEGDKPLGFGESANTIGQVELQLQASDDRYSLNWKKSKGDDGLDTEDYNTEKLTCQPAASGNSEYAFASEAWRGAKEGEVDNTKTIYIKTDPNTGEFSAMLPPLKYKVISAKLVKGGASVISSGQGMPEYDLTSPMLTEKDSLALADGSMLRYECNAKAMLTYHNEPSFTVQDKNADAGAFGIKEYAVSDKFGEATISDIYKVANGAVTYTYGAPLFVMCDPYEFQLKAFEEYVNADNGNKAIVPLEGVEVTIDNQLADDQAVFIEGANEGQVADGKSNVVTLDEKGEATYKWKGGLPNISKGTGGAPDYARTISMSYELDGRTYTWPEKPMYGVILGDLTTGTNFVTSGPDKVDMILRDPPGTASHAEWASGSTSICSSTLGGTWNMDETIATHTALGVKIETVNGVGVAAVLSSQFTNNLDVGVHITEEGERSRTETTTITTTRTISTSSEPEYVGSQGDVYIGRATNITYGKARQVDLMRQSASEPFELGKKDVYSTGLKFGTTFNYTQNYIENVLIPNFEAMLEQKLITVDKSEIEGYANNTDELMYITTHKPGDEGFGKKNYYGAELKERIAKGESTMDGPNYWVIRPSSAKDTDWFEDEVNWIIDQIESWKNTMAMNEKDKVTLFNKDFGSDPLFASLFGDLMISENVSFDSGSKVAYEWENNYENVATTEQTFTTNIIAGFTQGFGVNETGVIFELATENGGGVHTAVTDGHGTTNKFMYELAETGDDDALTVDIVQSRFGWSPVFRTRGGQTSGPYEGEERTKYYEPGKHVLNEATMQIEVPKIAVETPVVSDVPTGSAANFNLLLTNESEIDEDVYYKLLMIDESNSVGGSLKIDGQPLTEGRRIKIPAGETVKKLLQLTQSDISVLDYENIGIVLASETQYDPTSTWDQIADTVYITAHFVPSSSDVTLHIDRPLLNTAYGAKLELSFDNFDRQFNGLKAFRVQYKRKGEANWTTAQEYVLIEKDVTSNNALLPSGASVPFVYDMSSMTDDEYTFRILSAATYGNSEVTRSSNEITVVKDMARPQLISLPSPADGILNAGDEIALTFNEDIRSGAIIDQNFIVQGKLNNALVEHDGVFQNTNANGEGARTSAAVSLDGKPFAVGAWINWTAAGSVFRHGTAQNYFDISITEDGKLKATIAGNEYVSEKTVPQGKWSYLNVSYEFADDQPVLKAQVATGSEDKVVLFSGNSVAKYSGNGAVTIGKGINAAIHEVTLWNKARSWDDVNASRTLAASTDGLIGYWSLNEGHGTVGEDKARSRHLTLPSDNTWSMESVNYSLKLDGSSYAALDMSKIETDADQNYMVEFWFRADKQNADATIMHFMKEKNAEDDPTLDLELVATPSGSLKLNVNGETTSVTSDNVTDGAWHHFALNVLKGISGLATAYVDGAAKAQMSAGKLPAIRTDKLVMGAHRSYDPATFAYGYGQHFKGEIDEVRFWNGTQTAALIRDNMHSKADAETASSLALYYPFEKRTTDEYGQTGFVADLADHSAATSKADDAAIIGAANTVPTVSDLKLKNAPLMDKVPFTFVASERKLLINISESYQQLIEGCKLEFTVRNVQDMNGNNCKDIKWNAYVSQNQLAWGEGSVDVVKEGTNATSFQAEIINTSGEIANWSLSGMPMWLSASSEAGSLTPMSQKTLTFTVDEATAIGRYEAVIGLSGDNGVASNLIVNLLVTGELPDWTVNPDEYENSMNMVAQLNIGGAVSEDPDDIVAAFIDGECRGVAHPEYLSRYDAYMVMMNVYGNSDINKKVTFKAFDASTGDVYPEVYASQEVKFSDDMIYGTPANPIILTATDNLEQSQEARAGWNWISLYVEPQDMSVDNVLKSVSSTASAIKDKSTFTQCYDGYWWGDLETMAIGKMYKLQMNTPATLSVIGKLVDPQAADRAIAIKNGTNWIGYNANYYLSPDEAFAGLNPEDEDVVKSKDAFAIYMDYEWVGTLKALEPGKGYVYKSNATSTKSFNYPKSSASRLKAPMMAEEETQDKKYESCPSTKYEGNMNIVAQAWKNDQPIECEIAVFDSNGECRGSNMSMYDNNLVFLTVQGEGEGEPLTIRVVYTERGSECDELIDEVVYFVNDAVIGKVSKPMFIDLGGNSDSVRDAYIDAEETQYYNLRGIRVDESYEGFRISKGNKTLNK